MRQHEVYGDYYCNVWSCNMLALPPNTAECDGKLCALKPSCMLSCQQARMQLAEADCAHRYAGGRH